MTEFITVEPAHEQRGPFAVWAISQTPPLQTSSSTGFDVPVDLYPTVPVELLAGAYVDGYRYDVASPQPVLPEPAVEHLGLVDRLPGEDPDQGVRAVREAAAEDTSAPTPRQQLTAERKPRKRAATKRAGGGRPRKQAELTISADQTEAVIQPIAAEASTEGTDGG
jgi:hypothetical protein